MRRPTERAGRVPDRDGDYPERRGEVGRWLHGSLLRSGPAAADLVITMGWRRLPLYPGKRYEDWQLNDPTGQDVAAVRPIRDEIRRRVETLLASLQVAPTR